MATTKVAVAAAIALAIGTAGALAACTKKGSSGDPSLAASTTSASASASTIPSGSASLPAAVLAPIPGTWPEMVRVGRWAEAAAAIDALPPAERSRPDIAYVRARAAMALRDFPAAIKQLEGLETKLGAFASDIQFQRATAQLNAGPVEAAAQYFARQTGVRELTQAAVAGEKAGKLKEARDAIDRAVRAAKKSENDDAVEAHAVRARIAEALGDKQLAASDLRFVARYAPHREDDDDLSESIGKLDPSSALTASDRIDRAHRLARSGNADAAQEEIDRAEQSAGKGMSRGEITYARAMSFYLDRGHYPEAADKFEQAAKLDHKVAADALFYAARAWSRADRNDKARERYREVVKRFPSHSTAERASHQLARLDLLDGKWSHAAETLSAHVGKYKRGNTLKEAQYELAIANLLAKRFRPARKQFSDLARRSGDDLSQAMLRHLEAVAMQGGGDNKGAAEIWRQIVRDEPLSWPAMMASARLSAAGISPPPPIEPPKSDTHEPARAKLPPEIEMLMRLGLERDAEDRLRQIEGELTRGRGLDGPEILCNTYGALARGRRRYLVAQNSVSVALLNTAPSSGNRWAWECFFPSAYRETVQAMESQLSLPSNLILAIMRQESAFHPEARSPVGAMGLMQLMPNTARKIAQETGSGANVDQLTQPFDNMDLGSRYLAKLITTFHGHLPSAVAAYNAGPKAVGRWLARADGVAVDVWVALIPYAETRRYVARVMGNLARYGYLANGDSGLPAIPLALPSGISVGDDAY